MSMEFYLTITLILFIFIINIVHLLCLIIRKERKRYDFFHCILFNYSISSLIIAIWLIPVYYFRLLCSSESFLWRLWSFLFHIVDGVQLYSLLLLITNTNTLPLCFQRLFICLSWLAPVITYSPILWWSIPHVIPIDYSPYRRLTLGIPQWILLTIYVSMYGLPICLSMILTSLTRFCPWIDQYSRRRSMKISQKEIKEHRENMAELTSLVETVLSFELDPTPNETLNTWIPSISSFTIPSYNINHSSLSSISNKFHRSSSYKASQDHSYLFSTNISSSSPSVDNNDNVHSQTSIIPFRLLFLLSSLFLLVHSPYVWISLTEHRLSLLPISIYIHWFGTVLLPMVHFQTNA